MNKVKIAEQLVKIAKELQGSKSSEIADEFTRFCLGDSRVALNKLSQLRATTKSLSDSSDSEGYNKEYGKMFSELKKVIDKYTK